MANQLCHSAETNHWITQSITVSHGNTSPQVSLFIKLDSTPTPVSGVDRGDVGVFGVCTLAALSSGSYLSFLGALGDISSQWTLTLREAEQDQSKDRQWFMVDRANNSNKNFIKTADPTPTTFSISVFAPLFSASSTKRVDANVSSVSLSSPHNKHTHRLATSCLSVWTGQTCLVPPAGFQ